MFIASISLMADPPVISKKFEKELSKYFESESVKIIEIKELSIVDDIFFKVFNGEKESGIVVLTSAKGRYDKFDYMIIYNLGFEIQLIKILVYRSEYGSEITAKRWLSQFYNAQLDNLRYGSDIQAISGATFSASSLTKNINRINKILKNYKGS
jgi:hypothetical protein